MRTIAITAFSLTAALAASAAGTAHAQQNVRHLPPAEAEPAEPLMLTVNVNRGWESELQIRFRPLGTVAWGQAVFTRKDRDQYVVTVPADALVPPGLEYFIVSTAEGNTALEFASSELPHRVVVHQDKLELRRERYLDRYRGHQAQLRTAGEYVDYGVRQIGTKQIPDRYYRVEVDAGYRMFSFPLKTLRFGFTQLLGLVPRSRRDDDGSCLPADPIGDCQEDVGFKGGGWFELNFVLRDGIEFDARGMVMATQGGFNVGGRGEFRIGVEEGTHLAVGSEVIATVGASGYFRLGWGTVPSVPMAATVEVTTFPASHRAPAVRLLYDVSHPFANGLTLGLRVGYQARDQLIGGATAGGRASFEF